MNQNTSSKKIQALPAVPVMSKGELITIQNDLPDRLTLWAEAYFRYEVTTSAQSQREQRRDLKIFFEFMWQEEKTDDRVAWSPRLSRSFINYLRSVTNTIGKKAGQRRWSDRTVNRVVAHLKTFSKWVHKLRPFPLGNPMRKIQSQQISSPLEIERALTSSERRRLLDSADLLLQVGGLSKDRRRGKNQEERKKRSNFRAYRNRAMIYALIETGMRRGAIANADLNSVDFEKRIIKVEEKGGHQHNYAISKEGIRAITEYVQEERQADQKNWPNCQALFLTASVNGLGDGRMNNKAVNSVWDEVCALADVKGKTPHSARHAMGRYIIEKTGNVAAVQRQLGHKNAAYSMQYARITSDELKTVLDER